jgi:hypothetical protein
MSWKIGRTVKLDARLKEISMHVPMEILDQNWKIELTQQWTSERLAQAMEQLVLAKLNLNRTVGERVRASESEINKAWTDAIVEIAVEAKNT